MPWLPDLELHLEALSGFETLIWSPSFKLLAYDKKILILSENLSKKKVPLPCADLIEEFSIC
jgi:hypothetical protein